MGVASSKLTAIAFKVFDRYGRLSNQLQGQGPLKGTGVWSNELDLGDPFLIDEI